jgi:hypothetical protein
VSRVVDVLCVVLLIGAIAGFAFGLGALEKQRDLDALYFLVLGAVLLKCSTDLLRPRPS